MYIKIYWSTKRCVCVCVCIFFFFFFFFFFFRNYSFHFYIHLFPVCCLWQKVMWMGYSVRLEFSRIYWIFRFCMGLYRGYSSLSQSLFSLFLNPPPPDWYLIYFTNLFLSHDYKIHVFSLFKFMKFIFTKLTWGGEKTFIDFRFYSALLVNTF